MRRSVIFPAFVETIPDRLQEGTLYICERYRTAAHKCCCGCGEEVITPLTPADWAVFKEGDAVSLMPSIGNWNFKCKSHYWIRNNSVFWAGALSKAQIARVQVKDKADKEAYIAVVNRTKEKQLRLSILSRLWQTIKRGWTY